MCKEEGHSLLPTQRSRSPHPSRPRRRYKGWAALVLLACLAKLAFILYPAAVFVVDSFRAPGGPTPDFAWLDALIAREAADASALRGMCPQHAPYEPPVGQGKNLTKPHVGDLAKLLSGAINVDTSVGDAWPPVTEAPDLWGPIFRPFREYLARALPALHGSLSPINLTLVNEHGLLYTWPGSNTSLGPLLLMAHQDVVPVEPSTYGEWAYPPFSGHITPEGNIFGRGSEDTKSSLVTILASLQSLLKSGFQPQRTILVSFGFDEEAAGTEGAGSLAKYIEGIYGPESIAMLVDEGGEFALPNGELNIPATAAPAVSEKGYLDVSITVQTPGGHSSVPPPHTGIGLLSQAVVAIEKAPHLPILRSSEDSNPTGKNNGWDALLCEVALGKITGPLQQAILRLHFAQLHPPPPRAPRQGYDDLLSLLRQQVLDLMAPVQKVYFTTTQAVDLVNGGVKVSLPVVSSPSQWDLTHALSFSVFFIICVQVNALPESVTAVVNHRVEPGANVQSVREHMASVLKPVAQASGLHLDAWGMANLSYKHPNQKENEGSIILSDAYASALEPAPPTPVDGPEAEPWRLLASIIRRVWSNGLNDEGIVVYPSLSIGNTDCKSFYQLTKHVFRFSPFSISPPTPEELELPDGWGAHTVNEHLHQDALAQGWHFFTTLIQAVDLASF